jgi:signal transduction histidine kinase
VWNKRERGFGADDIRLMGLFADQSALALYNEQLHARNRHIAIEQERHRLARDLHDSVTQSLYSIALAAQTSLRLLDQVHTDRKIREALEHIQATSRTVLAEMREQLYDLYPTPLGETGLVKALAHHCEFLRRHHSLQIELTAGPEPALSALRREALYYIAREALWNTVKHASATRVGVSLIVGAEHIVLSVADDGVGFEPSGLTQGETMGLRNMEERAEQLGGTLKIISSLGQGTRVTVRVPSSPAEDQGGL